jgi:hypothetical protein
VSRIVGPDRQGITDNAVGLFDERDRDPPSRQRFRRRLQVGGLDAGCRAVPDRQDGPWLA